MITKKSKCPQKTSKEFLLKMAEAATKKLEREEVRYAKNVKRIKARQKVQKLSDGSIYIPDNMSGAAYAKLKKQMS